MKKHCLKTNNSNSKILTEATVLSNKEKEITEEILNKKDDYNFLVAENTQIKDTIAKICKVSIEKALDIDFPWVSPIEISFVEEKYKDYNTSQFDFKVDDFEYFNCNDTQLGKYAHYYVSVEDLEKQAMCNMMCS